jgi:hypothetical protein
LPLSWFRGYIAAERKQHRQRADASSKGVAVRKEQVRDDDTRVIEAVTRYRKKHGRHSRAWPTSKMILFLRGNGLVDYSERRLRNILSRLGLK